MQNTTYDQASLCGAPVHLYAASPGQPNPPPLLYEWRIYEAGQLTCVYIGKAKNGASRPLNTYPSVVRDLRRSRGVRKMPHIPVTPYFKRNPWGFRWIHHQLEASVERILNGNIRNERIELHFPKVAIPLSKLHAEEKMAIAQAKAAYAGTAIVANDRPSMRVQYVLARHLLDPIWI
jgi:hypothetical protein